MNVTESTSFDMRKLIKNSDKRSFASHIENRDDCMRGKSDVRRSERKKRKISKILIFYFLFVTALDILRLENDLLFVLT